MTLQEQQEAEALLFPLTPEQYMKAANTTGTPTNITLMNLIADKEFEQFLLEHFFMQMDEFRQKEKKEQEAMVQQWLAEKKYKEERDWDREEDRIQARIQEAQQQLATGSFSGVELSQMQAEVQKGIEALTARNEKLTTQIKAIDDKLNAAGTSLETSREEKVAKLKVAFKQKLKKGTTYKIRDANGQDRELKEDQVDQMAEIANKKLTPLMLRANPDMVKHHEELEKEDQRREQKKAEERAQGKEVQESKVKPIAEIQLDKLNLFGELELILWLNKTLGYQTESGKNLNPLTLASLSKKNPEIHEIMRDIRKSYSQEDIKKVREMFGFGAERAHLEDQKSANYVALDKLMGLAKTIEKKLPPKPSHP